MFRERAGTAASVRPGSADRPDTGRHANLCARATPYKDSGAFPGGGWTSSARGAYLDLLNGMSAEERIAHGLLTDTPDPDPNANANAPEEPRRRRPGANPAGDEPERRPAGGLPGAGATAPAAIATAAARPRDDSDPDDDDPDDDSPTTAIDHGEPDDGGPGDRRRRRVPATDPAMAAAEATAAGGPGRQRADRRQTGETAGGAGPGLGAAAVAAIAVPAAGRGPRPVLHDLIFPLATLLGLAERPGEGHGLGALDPALCRALAATAAPSPHTTICVTVTDADGIAIGHGCGKPGRLATPAGGPAPPLFALPARINLTVTAARLAELRATPAASLEPPPRPSRDRLGARPARHPARRHRARRATRTGAAPGR